MAYSIAVEIPKKRETAEEQKAVENRKETKGAKKKNTVGEKKAVKNVSGKKAFDGADLCVQL